MKKLLLIFLFGFILIKTSSAQLLCVQCFQQNDSIGLNVGSHNLILNGGFENTTCLFSPPYDDSYCPNSSHYTGCSISNWTCIGGGNLSNPTVSDSNNYKVVQGIRAPCLFDNYCDVCSTGNDTSCLHNSQCKVTGVPAIGYPVAASSSGGTTGIRLSQIVNGLIPGNTYILEFWTGGVYLNGNYPREGLFGVNVGFGNIFLKCKPTAPHTGVGTRYLIEFKPVSSSDTISFSGWGAMGNGCTQLVLDDVRLYTPNYLPNQNVVCSLSVNALSNETQIIITPNPTSSLTTISFSEEQTNTTIKLTDITGRMINDKWLMVNGKTATLDMSGYTKGIYFVQITDANKNVVNRKVVVE